MIVCPVIRFCRSSSCSISPRMCASADWREKRARWGLLWRSLISRGLRSLLGVRSRPRRTAKPAFVHQRAASLCQRRPSCPRRFALFRGELARVGASAFRCWFHPVTPWKSSTFCSALVQSCCTFCLEQRNPLAMLTSESPSLWRRTNAVHCLSVTLGGLLSGMPPSQRLPSCPFGLGFTPASTNAVLASDSSS